MPKEIEVPKEQIGSMMEWFRQNGRRLALVSSYNGEAIDLYEVGDGDKLAAIVSHYNASFPKPLPKVYADPGVIELMARDGINGDKVDEVLEVSADELRTIAGTD